MFRGGRTVASFGGGGFGAGSGSGSGGFGEGGGGGGSTNTNSANTSFFSGFCSGWATTHATKAQWSAALARSATSSNLVTSGRKCVTVP